MMLVVFVQQDMWRILQVTQPVAKRPRTPATIPKIWESDRPEELTGLPSIFGMVESTDVPFPTDPRPVGRARANVEDQDVYGEVQNVEEAANVVIRRLQSDWTPSGNGKPSNLQMTF